MRDKKSTESSVIKEGYQNQGEVKGKCKIKLSMRILLIDAVTHE